MWMVPKFAAAMMRELNSLPLDKYEVQTKPQFRLRVGMYRDVNEARVAKIELVIETKIQILTIVKVLFEQCGGIWNLTHEPIMG